MNYTIKQLDSFSVIGQNVELTNSQSQNIKICSQFWRTFNRNLKKAYLSQSGNWEKYAFMERDNNRLLYFCSIPKRNVIPEGFTEKIIPACKYLVYAHIGSMDNIYDSYNIIYKTILPESGFIPQKDDFIHFEKYDYRFHWNRSDSVIEIWIPIQ